MMASEIVTIRNSRGLHAQAAAKFVETAEKFDSKITVSKDSQTVSGLSIMGLMMLAAGPGSEIEIKADGPEATNALSTLVALIENEFEES